MNNHHALLQRRSAEAGLTLIELMVALMLGLILIGGAIQVFVSNRAAYAFNEGFSRLQENGRFALDTIGYHARLAGYLGCRSGVTVLNNLGTPTSVPFNLEEGVFGYEAAGTLPMQTFAAAATDPANSSTETDWDPVLAADLDGSVIPGSDVLIVRHVSPQSYTLLSPFSSPTQVIADAPADAFAVGDIAVASDCTKSSVFQVTAVGNVAGGVTLSHSGVGTPGNATANWDTDQEYAAGAQVARGETWAFYVGARAAGPPALFQRRLFIDSGATTARFDVAEELAEAVEMMQVRYGLDADLDGAIEQYTTADVIEAGSDWASVAAVRIAIVTRSPEEYGTEVDDATYIADETIFDPVDDRRVRQVFVSTIAIRNRLP